MTLRNRHYSSSSVLRGGQARLFRHIALALAAAREKFASGRGGRGVTPHLSGAAAFRRQMSCRPQSLAE
jgi:hypothetical protein